MRRPSLKTLAEAVLSDRRDDEAHFHQGPTGAPAVCYDQRCSSPRLDIS